MVNLNTPNDELFNELNSEYKKALYWHTKHYGGVKKYEEFQRKLLKKVSYTNKDETGDIVEYVSPKGNRWIIFESCRWYPESNGAHTGAHTFCYYETASSIGAFRLTSDGRGTMTGVLIFTSHFFERFCERLGINKEGDVKEKNKQLVKNFINYFPAMVLKVYPRSEKDGKIHVDLRTSGSLSRGIVREGGNVKVIEIRSFLTDKQLNKKQLRETEDIRIKGDRIHKYEPEEMRSRRLLCETARDGLEAVIEREIQQVEDMGIPREVSEYSVIAGITIMNAYIDDNLADSKDEVFWTEHGNRNADIINDFAYRSYSDKDFNAGKELIKLTVECLKRDRLDKKCHMKTIAKSILTKTFMVSEDEANEMVKNLDDKLR